MTGFLRQVQTVLLGKASCLDWTFSNVIYYNVSVFPFANNLIPCVPCVASRYAMAIGKRERGKSMSTALH